MSQHILTIKNPLTVYVSGFNVLQKQYLNNQFSFL